LKFLYIGSSIIVGRFVVFLLAVISFFLSKYYFQGKEFFFLLGVFDVSALGVLGVDIYAHLSLLVISP